MSEWELEISVLFLLGLWACEVLAVARKYSVLALSTAYAVITTLLTCQTQPFRRAVIRRRAPIIPIIVRRLLVMGRPSRADVAKHLVADKQGQIAGDADGVIADSFDRRRNEVDRRVLGRIEKRRRTEARIGHRQRDDQADAVRPPVTEPTLSRAHHLYL